MTRRFVGGAGAAPCDTVTVRPAMVRVVLRAVAVEVAENETVALPVPDPAPVTVNHVAPLVAVHGQPVVAVRVTEPVPPPPVRLTVVGDAANEHGVWVTVSVRPAIVNVPVRADAVTSGVTE